MKLSHRESLKQFRVDPERWDSLAASHWEAKAGILSLPLAAPLITEAEFLAAVTRAFTLAPAAAALSIDGVTVGPDDRRRTDGSLLPSSQDDSVSAYVDRTMAALGAASLYGYLPGVQVFAADLWFRCRELLAPLVARVGLPANRIEMDLFWGRYDATPTRIHKDSANLTYVVAGTKKMLVWPHDAFAHLPEVQARQPRYLTNMFLGDAVRLEEHADRAIPLEARAGEVMYWPSDYWHIGVGQGEVVQTMTIAFYLCDDVALDLDAAMKRVYPAEKRHFTNFTLPVRRGADGRTVAAPPERAASVERLLELFQASLATQAQITAREWTRKVTAAGFTRVPPLEEDAPLTDEDLVGDADFPVLVWDSPLALHVFCNGHGEMFGPSDPTTLALVDFANTGARFRVEEWLERASGADDPDEARAEAARLLAFLLRARGVYRCDDGVTT